MNECTAIRDKRGSVRINVRLRRVRVTTVAVEKCIPSVYLYP